MYEFKHVSIKHWAEDDRPREKLLSKGRSALSITELLAILIGSGTRSATAIDIGKQIINQCENDLNLLAKWNVQDFTKIKGVGEAKAITLIAAIELGRRRSAFESPEKGIISSSNDAFHLVKEKLMDLEHEEFWIILLNRKNAVIKLERISAGGVAGTVVDPKIVFKKALDHIASGIILIHNHPSGNIKPSNEDIQLTKSMSEAARLLSLKILDHLIFTNNHYFSFADQGIL